MSAARSFVSRIFGLAPAPRTGLHHLGDAILFRASAAGADRISFGSPAGCTAPPHSHNFPCVDVWFHHDGSWSYFDRLPATMALSLVHHLYARFPELSLPWSEEGGTLQVEKDGATHDVRLRLGMESSGIFVVDLLPKSPAD